MGILQRVLREHVTFEPANPVHRAAYWHLRTTGRQFEKLRFVVEEGFSSVLTMMQAKISDHYCRLPMQSGNVTPIGSVTPIARGEATWLK